MFISYSVVIEDFARRHYIKSFEKKYKGAWDVTLRAITEQFKRIDVLLETPVADYICGSGNVRIFKTEFRITGTQESRKSSGNRCIVAVHTDTTTVHILLVYQKTDLSGKNETAEWKQLVRDNYSEYGSIL
ncbi:MAG: hypothetical protein AAB448_03865 [Patescibacteria group bacterium]